MAGGPKALASAVEVNEDSESWQRDIARRRPTRKDVVIGLSASGTHPLRRLSSAPPLALRGAFTAAVNLQSRGRPSPRRLTSPSWPRSGRGHLRLYPDEGRICTKNGAQHDHHRRHDPPRLCVRKPQVNVHMQNSKLVERGIRILMKACNIDRTTAVDTIKSAGRSVPVPWSCSRPKSDKPEAVRRLAKSDGNVRLAIEDNVLDCNQV